MSYTRQRKYQYFHKLDGKCINCQANAFVKPNGKLSVFCKDHLTVHRERQRQPGARRNRKAGSYQDGV